MEMDRFVCANNEVLVIRFERGRSYVYRLEAVGADTYLFDGWIEKCYDFCKKYMADVAESLF